MLCLPEPLYKYFTSKNVRILALLPYSMKNNRYNKAKPQRLTTEMFNPNAQVW
jgi:hypothetical protein